MLTIEKFLRVHPAWRLEEEGQHQSLVRTYENESFAAAIAMVSGVALLADERDHHPDIDIRYKRVTFRLSTHDAGNRVTARDTDLAKAIDELYLVRT